MKIRITKAREKQNIGRVIDLVEIIKSGRTYVGFTLGNESEIYYSHNDDNQFELIEEPKPEEIKPSLTDCISRMK